VQAGFVAGFAFCGIWGHLGNVAGRAQKLPSRRQERRWRIMRVTATPAKQLGHVYAPDEDTALKKAIEEFEVPAPWRGRLLAIRETQFTRLIDLSLPQNVNCFK
jgi:hypothetical protein